MKINKILLFVFISIFLIHFSSAWTSSTFNNSLTNENLTFTGNQNLTRYISIPRAVTSITNATINLTGFHSNRSNMASVPDATAYDAGCSYTAGRELSKSNDNQTSTKTQLAFESGTCNIFHNFTTSTSIGEETYIDTTFEILFGNSTFSMSYFDYGLGSYQSIYSDNCTTVHANTFPGLLGEGSCVDNLYVGYPSSGSSQYLEKLLIPSAAINAGNPLSIRFTLFYTVSDVISDFYETAFFETRYPLNPNFKINGTLGWNYTNSFNQTNNKSGDLSSYLNTAISNNCIGGIIQGNNCTVAFTFHSDTQGILKYSGLSFTGVSSPNVTLVSPLNSSVAGQNQTFIANVTDVGVLTNMTFYLWNSTGSLVNKTNFTISGISNQSSIFINFTYSDTYKWNFQACNTDPTCSFSQNNNNTLIVDIVNPVINLNAPTNNQWINSKNYSFNCTTTSTNLDSGFLYANFTGTWALNKTIPSITSGQVTSFNVTNIPSDGSYLWTCAVNKTTGTTVYYSQVGNFTVNVDTVYPTISINSITSSVGSQTISANSTSADSHLSTCKYSIFNSTGSIDGLSNNVSYTCNSLLSATVTAYATYNLTVYASDLAGNENSTTQTFTITAQGTTTGGGGGGGSSATIPVIGLNDINGTVAYSPLQREIIYAVMNNYCSLKVRNQALAVADYSQECTLTQTDLTNVQNNLNTFNVNVPLADLTRFYQNYKNGALFQGAESQDTINRYNLFTSVLGLTSLLQLSPPSVDTPVFITFSRNQTYTIVYNVLANKPLAICDVVSEDPNLQCTIQGNSTVRITYLITNPNFLSKIFSGVVTVITDAPADKLEQKRLSVVFRVYNLGYKIVGIPLYLIMILVIVGGIGGSIYFVRKRSRKKGKGLNSLKSILEVGK